MKNTMIEIFNQYTNKFEKKEMVVERYYKPDNIAIMLMDEEGPFGRITTNLNIKLDKDEFFVDTNNFPDGERALAKNNIATDTGKVCASGFCIYPVYKLNPEYMPS